MVHHFCDCDKGRGTEITKANFIEQLLLQTTNVLKVVKHYKIRIRNCLFEVNLQLNIAMLK